MAICADYAAEPINRCPLVIVTQNIAQEMRQLLRLSRLTDALIIRRLLYVGHLEMHFSVQRPNQNSHKVVLNGLTVKQGTQILKINFNKNMKMYEKYEKICNLFLNNNQPESFACL